VRYRDKTELIASILKAANGRNVNTVQIMYKAFLSYTEVRQYISILIDGGMIKFQEGNRRNYRITDKGIRFLDLHNKLGELLTKACPSKTIIIY
jgi:predicted transcriptional regulator